MKIIKWLRGASIFMVYYDDYVNWKQSAPPGRTVIRSVLAITAIVCVMAWSFLIGGY